jgi:hypothetical protein
VVGVKVKGEHDRRGRDDYEELDRLLAEADSSPEGENLHGAQEALEQAGVKAAWMRGEIGQAALRSRTRKLVGLLSEVREDLNRPRRSIPDAPRKNLCEIRSRFALEAHRDAKKTAAGGRSPAAQRGSWPDRVGSSEAAMAVRESLRNGISRAPRFSLRCSLAKRGRR